MSGMECSADGCRRDCTHESDLGPLCQHHYMAWRRYGYLGSAQPERCTVDGCAKKSMATGLCSMHYNRRYRYGTTDDIPRKNARRRCSVDDCNRNVVGGGLCDMHYRRQRRYGSTDAPPKPAPMPRRVPTPTPVAPTCNQCDGPLPSSRSKYCSNECHQAFAYHLRRSTQRERQLAIYGLTIEDFDRILERQCGRCAICGTSDPGRKGFCVDHCHDTGRVRGLLCTNCNVGIGQLGDDVDRLMRAVEYLKANPKPIVNVGA